METVSAMSAISSIISLTFAMLCVCFSAPTVEQSLRADESRGGGPAWSASAATGAVGVSGELYFLLQQQHPSHNQRFAGFTTKGSQCKCLFLIHCS